MTDTVQVPREATEEMLQAMDVANATYIAAPKGYWPAVYRAMIAAAPQATDPRDAEIERLTRERDEVRDKCFACITPAEHSEAIATLTAERDALREVLQTLVERLRTCRTRPKSGVSGQTIDAQMRNSYLVNVEGGWLLDAEDALEAIASAPHPAHDATDPVNDLLGGGPYYGMKDTAPDATDWKARCEAAEEWNRLRAQDIMMLGHLAGQTLDAQAENKKLREALGEAIELADQDQFVSGATLARWAALTTQPSKQLTAALAEIEKLRDALGEAIELASQDDYALTPAGEAMVARWTALSPPPLSPEKP